MAHAMDDDDLPQVWPFSLAGVFIVVAIIWFLLGFAFHDAGAKLPGQYVVWWICLLIAAVLIVGGGIWNTLRSRRRIAAQH